ncbi:hypothetical protein Tco_0844669 [Tanacetum coccineum]
MGENSESEFGYATLEVIDTPYSIDLNTPYQSVECQYAVLNLQNTPYCLNEQDTLYKLHNINTMCLYRKLDTSYSTGEYAVSGVLSEHCADMLYLLCWIQHMPKIEDKDHFELKGQFLKELHDSGSDNEDANVWHLNITNDKQPLRGDLRVLQKEEEKKQDGGTSDNG